MSARICKSLLIAALALSLGSQWVFIQSVAWVGMLCSYSQANSLREAVVMTFDGQHPCRLCKVAQETRHSERTRQLVQPEWKIEAWIGLNESPVFTRPGRPSTPLQISSVPSPRRAPPVPPPRCTSLG